MRPPGATGGLEKRECQDLPRYLAPQCDEAVKSSPADPGRSAVERRTANNPSGRAGSPPSSDTQSEVVSDCSNVRFDPGLSAALGM
jgi:hypothetical protein